MKKLFSLFILAILVVSAVPLAFAQDRMRQGDAPRPALYDGSAETPEPTMAERPADAPAPRLIMERARERLQDARLRYEQARERYQTARQNYQQRRATFQSAKDELKTCQSEDSETCDQARERVRQNAGEFLKKSADLVLEELNRVKAKVESSEDLSDEEVAQIVADLDDRISEVEDAKAVIDDLGEDATREEINAAAKTIRKAWMNTKQNLHRAVGKLAVARLHNVVVQTEQLSERFEKTKERLAAQGEDVTALESIIDDFNAQLEIAKAKYEESRAVWENAEAGSVDEASKEATDLMREAKDALVKARELLRDAVQEVRGLNQGQLDLEPADDSAE